jgi:hypothetical protein
MWVEQIEPEKLAELLHHYQQALGVFPDGSEDRSWQTMAQPERTRLVAAARLTLLELDSDSHEQQTSRSYFAEPGKAEWGS